MRTFINSQNNASFNDQVIKMLYMYWHELSNDDFFDLLPDEEQEVQDLVDLLPKQLILKQITQQNTTSDYTVYTYVFEIPGSLLGPKVQAYIESKVEQFLSHIQDLNNNEGSYYVTPIQGTNTIIGTFTIG